MLLAEFLPTRSSDDIIAERVRIRLGGEDILLPDLSIAETEAWQAQFAAELAVIVGQVSASDDPRLIMARLTGLVPLQLTLLRAYDRDGRLPDDEWIRTKASPSAVLKAFLEVLAAAHPMAAVLLDGIVRNPDSIRELIRQTPATASPPPTNGSHPPTAGKRVRSGAT